MMKKKGYQAFNLGNGDGFSVLQIIKECEKVTKKEIAYEIVNHRDGDPAKLVADNNLEISSLNWNPKYKDINDIIKSAWSWHSKNT